MIRFAEFRGTEEEEGNILLGSLGSLGQTESILPGCCRVSIKYIRCLLVTAVSSSITLLASCCPSLGEVPPQES